MWGHYERRLEAEYEQLHAPAAVSPPAANDVAAQRQAPDPDALLKRLLVELEAARPASMERAAVLVGLADVAAENHDNFEAGKWLTDAVAELATIGYPIPDSDDTDRAVISWIEAMPGGDGGDPVPFERRFSDLAILHMRLAKVQGQLALWREMDGKLSPDTPGAAAAEAHMRRLADIVIEAPAHAGAVRTRMASQSGRPDGPGAAIAGSPNRPHEVARIERLIGELSDLLSGSGPRSPEDIGRWRQMANVILASASACGSPVTVARALYEAARVEEAADELEAAIALHQRGYEQVADVPGDRAAAQAVIALSQMALLQFAGLKNRRAALDLVCVAVELIERDRYRVSAPFQQAEILTPHTRLFQIGIRAAWDLAHDNAAPDLAEYDRMLGLMELTKARASIRRLFLHAIRGGSEPDDGLNDLNDRIHSLDPKIGPVEAAGERERLRERARRAQQPLRQQRLRLWDLRAIATRDSAAKVPPVKLARLQAALEPDEAIIYYYWLSPETLLVVTITDTDVAAERKRVEPGQRMTLERLKAVLGLLTGSNRSLDAKFVEPLAAVLTPVKGRPLLEGKHRLILSPHRLLHWYPFAAMPFRDEPLVQSFALRYIPNLTSLLVPRPVAGAPRVNALAVREFPGRPDLGELDYVHRQAADIASEYARAGIPAAVIADPTRAAMLAAMRDGTLNGAWCLHLATHGYSLMDEVSRDAPLEAVLELADNSVDGYEIAAADLACEVVVLTACFSGQRSISGRGRAEQPGDELFGLSAAFLDARCRSVLAPVWPADGESTSQIVTVFHRHLAQGAPADIALAQAQREFLAGATFWNRPAYYWAPLVLTTIGRPMPIAGTPPPLASGT